MSSPLQNSQLAGLYPFLAAQRHDEEQMQQVLLESVRQKSDESLAVKQRFFREFAPQVVAAARALAAAYTRGGRLYTMGNGGSSCDSAHIAVEFQHPVTAGRPALAAHNLANDCATLTAVGNDLGFQHVFLRQVIALLRPQDVLIGVSTSGNSDNLLLAFAAAKQLGATTIGLAGGDGGKMLSSAALDHCLVAPSDSIHRVQETHVAIYHILWDLTHTLLADTRGSAASEL
ncbi:MAG TPA: SIS domain-containing protein [Steroidobacteraceae bacterium]|jgi:D-sedoheptulose 7-phosphate isomerase